MKAKKSVVTGMALIVTALGVFAPGALSAVSWIYNVQGYVHSVWTTPSGVTFLKVERPDGSKVAADCMLTDEIRNGCLQADLGDPADGDARCELGVCTWMSLELPDSYTGGSSEQ